MFGGKIEVPTIDGVVDLTVPKGVSSGRVLRLRGRGVERHDAQQGDRLVELRIVLPPEIGEELGAFLQDWRKSHPYHPRKGLFEGGK